MQRAGEVVVGFHRGAFARDRRHRHAVAGREIGAVKAVAGHQHHAADAGRRRRAFRLAHALDRERRRLGAHARAPPARATDGNSGSSRSSSGCVRASSVCIGKAGELVLGRDLGHRDRALGERRDVAGDVVGRDHRRAAADEHAQARRRRFRSAPTPRPRLRARRPTATSSAPRPHRRHRRRRGARRSRDVRRDRSVRIDREVRTCVGVSCFDAGASD